MSSQESFALDPVNEKKEGLFNAAVKKGLARAEVYASALEGLPGYSWMHRRTGVIFAHHSYMFDPTGSWRISWDIAIIMPILCYLTVMLPFRMCFENEPVLNTAMYWLEVAVELVSFRMEKTTHTARFRMLTLRQHDLHATHAHAGLCRRRVPQLSHGLLCSEGRQRQRQKRANPDAADRIPPLLNCSVRL